MFEQLAYRRVFIQRNLTMATTILTWLKLKVDFDELHISQITFNLWKPDGRRPSCYKIPKFQYRMRRIDLEE